MELQDFPYTGERRPFDWFDKEEQLTSYAPLDETVEPYSSLVVAMLFYMADRKKNYINYMRLGKLIFQTMVPPGLKDKSPDHTSWVTKRIGVRGTSKLGIVDWPPAYEIQRLWIVTGIHWSWLELAWLEAETIIWDSNNGKMKAKLERVF